MEYTSLIDQLEKKLTEFSYTKESAIGIPDVQFIAYVERPQYLKTRNLCAAMQVPDEIVDNKTAKRFFSFIRSSLLDKYGDAFLWKELEIIFVIFCKHEIYEMLKEDGGEAVDQAAFSLSAMLGASFIDTKNYDNFLHSNWGIYFSGKHLQAVNQLVETWCTERKNSGQTAQR